MVLVRTKCLSGLNILYISQMYYCTFSILPSKFFPTRRSYLAYVVACHDVCRIQLWLGIIKKIRCMSPLLSGNWHLNRTGRICHLWLTMTFDLIHKKYRSHLSYLLLNLYFQWKVHMVSKVLYLLCTTVYSICWRKCHLIRRTFHMENTADETQYPGVQI